VAFVGRLVRDAEITVGEVPRVRRRPTQQALMESAYHRHDYVLLRKAPFTTRLGM
jgi:hypothetical protein